MKMVAGFENVTVEVQGVADGVEVGVGVGIGVGVDVGVGVGPLHSYCTVSMPI